MSRGNAATRWNLDALETTYQQWRQDPTSVDESWQYFFQGFELGLARPAPPARAPKADAGPTPSLVVQADKQTHVFSTDFTAGRQGSLVVADDHASNHHARFQFAHGAWYVEDLKSTNGTWLNNRRMFAAQRLKKGDKIKIGRTVIQVISA